MKSEKFILIQNYITFMDLIYLLAIYLEKIYKLKKIINSEI